MSGDDGSVPIRSFRVCFELERRLHKIDRWRIPVPYGVPLRGIAYAALLLLAVLILRRLPITGALLDALPFGFRYVLLPLVGAYVLTQLKLDGRSAHAAGVAWLRYQLAPSRVCAFRPLPRTDAAVLGQITVAPDERGARNRRGVIEGPARVTLRYPALLQPRGRTLRVRHSPGEPMWRGKQVNLRAGQRVVIE